MVNFPRNGSCAKTIDEFFAVARKSLLLHLYRKVGPVFQASELAKRDLNTDELAALTSSWIQVIIFVSK